MSGLARALERLADRATLSREETAAAVAEIIDGAASEVAIGAFLTALRVRGESAEELRGTVEAVRQRMGTIEGPLPELLDTCGTGGDGASTVNISTAAALVCAACGRAVAKHGNRSASGSSGSAEVLASLGVNIDAETPVVRRCLSELGITFLFAPRFHPALRHASVVRKQLPFRTLFNLVGPLVNPARPCYQLIGVPDRGLAEVMAATVALEPDRRRVVIVTGGPDSLDEVTLAGATRVLWVDQGRVTERTWTPTDFALPERSAGALRISGPEESAERLRAMLRGERGPVRDVVLANSAAGLLVAGDVSDLRSGVDRAAEAIDSGAAARLLDRWVRLSQGVG